MQDPNLLDDLDELAIKSPSKLPLLLFVFALLAGAGYLAWAWATTVEPTRVLVAIDIDGQWFEGSQPAARVTDALNERLKNLGFIPVTAGEPEVDAVLEANPDDLLSAAQSLKAAFLISGRLEKTVLPHPVDGGYFELRVAGDITVQHIDDAEPTRTAVHTWAGSRTEEDGLRRLTGRTLNRKIAAAALPPLVLHPTVQHLIENDANTAGTLRPARDYVANQGRNKRQFADAYVALAKRRLSAEKGSAKPTYHRALSAADGLCGAGPAGALIKTADIEPYVSSRTGALSWLDSYETVSWFSPEHGLRTLWEGYNVYSYPGASADGQVVAWVEDLMGWAKTVTVQVGDGEAKRLVVDPKKRFSALRPSPKGAHVALYERACRNCDAEIVIYAVADGAEVRRLGPHGGAFQGFTWLRPGELAVVHTPPFVPEAPEPTGETPEPEPEPEPEAAPDAPPAEPPSPFAAAGLTVWRVDLKGAAPEALHTAPGALRLSWPKASADGSHVAFAGGNDEGHGIALLDVAQRTLVHHPTDDRAVNPAFSPDGAWVVFSHGRSKREEIAVMNAADGTIRRLTENKIRDRYPWFSADGSRIWYESLSDDPNFPTKRTISVLTSVPWTP
jgi:hypothetical protein